VIRRAVLVLGLALALLAPAGSLAHAASAPVQRTTLADVEDEVMCVLCGTALNISESSQADRERAFIRRQIALGKTKDQVKQALVAEYGQQVLGTPSGGGFNAAAWLVPAAIVVALLAALALIVPRWRRSARSSTDAPALATTPALSAADARRLEEDIARYER
jgi:cytochrome c-type biogenesis protein CcmH/NrfF